MTNSLKGVDTRLAQGQGCSSLSKASFNSKPLGLRMTMHKTWFKLQESTMIRPSRLDFP